MFYIACLATSISLNCLRYQPFSSLQNDLQNPNNRREILLDDKMKAVFGCDSFTVRL